MRSFTLDAVTMYEHGGKPLDLGTPSSIFELYCNFTHLEKLDARSIKVNSTMLSHFSRLPNLGVIITSVDLVELNHFLSTSASDSEFPSLRILGLETTHLDACSRLLKRPGFRQLKSLRIVRRRGDDFWDLKSFFGSLEMHHSLLCLEKLCLQDFDMEWHRSNTEVRVSDITGDTLAPLSSFKNMVNIEINLDGCTDLNDADLLRISFEWPNLRILNLRERTTETIPLVTLAGLLSFVATFVKLESLSIRVNAFNFAHMGDIVPNHNMHFLMYVPLLWTGKMLMGSFLCSSSLSLTLQS